MTIGEMLDKSKEFAKVYLDAIFRKAKENDYSLFEAVSSILCLTVLGKQFTFYEGNIFCQHVIFEILLLKGYENQ